MRFFTSISSMVVLSLTALSFASCQNSDKTAGLNSSPLQTQLDESNRLAQQARMMEKEANLKNARMRAKVPKGEAFINHYPLEVRMELTESLDAPYLRYEAAADAIKNCSQNTHKKAWTENNLLAGEAWNKGRSNLYSLFMKINQKFIQNPSCIDSSLKTRVEAFMEDAKRRNAEDRNFDKDFNNKWDCSNRESFCKER